MYNASMWADMDRGILLKIRRLHRSGEIVRADDLGSGHEGHIAWAAIPGDVGNALRRLKAAGKIVHVGSRDRRGRRRRQWGWAPAPRKITQRRARRAR